MEDQTNPEVNKFSHVISNTRGFKMGAININSLSKHIDELKMFICDNPIDVLAVNETKLDCSIPDTVVYLPGYTCIRNDRTRCGGGVCMFIRNTITFRRIFELDSLDIKHFRSKFETPIQAHF